MRKVRTVAERIKEQERKLDILKAKEERRKLDEKIKALRKGSK